VSGREVLFDTFVTPLYQQQWYTAFGCWDQCKLKWFILERVILFKSSLLALRILHNIFSARMLNFISADDSINNHNFPTLHSQTPAHLLCLAQPSVLVSENKNKRK